LARKLFQSTQSIVAYLLPLEYASYDGLLLCSLNYNIYILLENLNTVVNTAATLLSFYSFKSWYELLPIRVMIRYPSNRMCCLPVSFTLRLRSLPSFSSTQLFLYNFLC
jgi:hypothetical protein